MIFIIDLHIFCITCKYEKFSIYNIMHTSQHRGAQSTLRFPSVASTPKQVIVRISSKDDRACEKGV